MTNQRHSMMKTRIHTLLPAALLLLATACEDTLNAPGNPATGNGPTLTLALDNREDNGQTRSELTDGAPVNHVESVRILVFKGTDDNATYVGEEVYADNTLKAISWPKAEKGQEKPDKITYRMNYPFVEGETYTLLGVGQDDKFKDTYKFINNNDKTDIKTGTTLSNAYAILKERESPKECDFYTGTTTFTHEGKKTHIDDLLMKRRVAGVMLYVNEIPADLPYNNTNYRTTHVDLKLGRTQKKSVQLYRNFLAEEWLEPEGEDLTDSDVLLSIDLSELNYGDKDEQGFYTIDNTTSANGLQDGALKAACYMLPLNVPTEDAANYKTFTVEIYGVENSAGQGTIPDDAEHVLLKSFTVEQRDTDGKSVTSFPIRSNYLYSIGKYDPDAGVDEPISLSGDPIYLEVLPFQPLDVSHDFGEARVQALFNPGFDEETKIFNCMNTTFDVEILPPLTTIRGRVKSITINIDYSKTYAINDNGERTPLSDIINEKYGSDELLSNIQNHYQQWIHMKDTDGKYTNSLDITKQVLENTGNEPIKIEFLIRDYAMPREWGWDIDQNFPWTGNDNAIAKIMDDIRDIEILMTTHLSWDSNGDGTEDESSDRTDALHISQYNTITVHYKNAAHPEDIAYCGFSREDLYDGTNEYYEDPYLFDWGFQSSNNYNIYTTNAPNAQEGSRNNGSTNLYWIGGLVTSNWESSWPSSAAAKAQYPFRICQTDGTIEPDYGDNEPISANVTYSDRITNCWYLPAMYELEGLMVMGANNSNPANLAFNQFYWSSTCEDSYETTAYACKTSPQNGYESEYLTRSNDNKQNAYIRQARQFPEEYNYEY